MTNTDFTEAISTTFFKKVHQTYIFLQPIKNKTIPNKKCYTKLKNIIHQIQNTLHQTYRILHEIIKNLHQTFFSSPNQENFPPS